MKNLTVPMGITLSACVFLCFSANAQAALFKRVAPFEGQIEEGFEDVANRTNLNNLAEGLASFTVDEDTLLTVQDGDFSNFWDQHAVEGQYFLGASAGRSDPATIEITFDYPVRGFGGSFGHRVHPLFDTTQEAEFVFYDANNKVIGRDKITIDSLPGAVNAHWQFTRGVKRITYTAVAPVVDALTVRLDPLVYRRFNRNKVRTNDNRLVAR
jgi:hypothetical protein